MRRTGRGWWWLPALLLAACGSSGEGADDAGEGGDAGDVEPDVPEVEPDVPEVTDTAEVPEAAPPLDPALGEVIELVAGADGAFTVDLATPAANRRYGLVLYSATWATGMLTYELTATGAAAKRLGETRAGMPERLDLGYRDLFADIPAIARAVREGTARFPRDPLPPPTLGERRSFQIEDPTRGVVTIEAECLRVGTDIAMWMDRSPGGGADPDPAVLDEVVARFDDTVLPREREFFGQEPDISTDGVVNLLWSPIVEAIGAMAFFSPCDMFDSASLPMGCSYSNEQELLYAMPPGTRWGGRASSILDTLSHELQHLIYFNRKVLVSGASGGENAYILEGWAAVGEDLAGYGRGVLFTAGAGLDASDTYGGYEILRNGAGYDVERDGMLRGAAYLLLRYLWDRAGGEEIAADGTITDLGSVAWAQDTIDSAQEGRRNFERSCGTPMDDLLFDWYTALLLTGRTDAAGAPLPVEPRFTYRPQVTDAVTGNMRGFDPYASFGGMFSLNGPVTVTVATADGQIPGTGNELVILDADGTSPALTVTVVGGERANLRVRVVRLR